MDSEGGVGSSIVAGDANDLSEDAEDEAVEEEEFQERGGRASEFREDEEEEAKGNVKRSLGEALIVCSGRVGRVLVDSGLNAFERAASDESFVC